MMFTLILLLVNIVAISSFTLQPYSATNAQDRPNFYQYFYNTSADVRIDPFIVNQNVTYFLASNDPTAVMTMMTMDGDIILDYHLLKQPFL